MSVVPVAVGLYLLPAGVVMPSTVRVGLFMLAFGGVALVAHLWKAATGNRATLLFNI
jgi:hypothetical protein